MLVYESGALSGTIGGGAIEANVIQRARELFKKKVTEIASYDLTPANNNTMDLICGGRLEVLVEYVASNRENEELHGLAYQKIQQRQPFLWVATAAEADGKLNIKREILKFPEANQHQPYKTIVDKVDGNPRLIEPILPSQTVYIIGAGHVSKEIARLTKQIGFRTLVFDDREEFANESRFPDVDDIHICPEYANVFESFEIGSNSYIIIVTHGHRFDKDVLAQALQTGAGYIGMIGSRRKRNTIYNALLREGVDQKVLKKVHCPIGLPIPAETPAEIAVSIAAELIEHRAKQSFHG